MLRKSGRRLQKLIETYQKKKARKTTKRKYAELISEDEAEELIMGSQAEEIDLYDCIVVESVAK